MSIKRLMSATALVGILGAIPSVTFAQTAPSTSTNSVEPAANTIQTGDPSDNPSNDGEIVVTGSRIARPTLSSPVPVTTISAQDLLSTGTLNIGDALNNLPALRSTFSQANSERFIGTSGLNLLDLRGLGTARTLVLVNGRRHVTASPGDYIVDTNTIPDDLLERVDIVTGGNSAVYGSDAVAGVVNFVLKRDFSGLKIAGQGSITSRGDRGSYFGSLTAGKNFADGRGNIAIALEYSKANAVYNVDRDDLTGAYSGRNQFNQSETTVGEPAAGNGVPDNQFYRGVRNGSIADGGLVTAVCNPTVAAQLADLNRCRASSTGFVSASNPGIGIGQRYVFNSAGQLVLSNPSLDFRDITTNFGASSPSSGSSNTIGGLGSTLMNTGQLLPSLERYSANILAHFDISDAFQPFVEAKYVRIYADQEGQPSFFSPISGTLGLPELRCNNGFLTAGSLATLQSIGRCVNPATDRFATSRFNTDFGGRGELHKRETYRIVGGVQGTFNDDWKYELAVNYGQYDEHYDSLNNLKLADLAGNDDGFTLAYDAVLAPASFSGSNFVLNSTGAKVICAVNSATNTRPDCVPINLFGVGAPSAAALKFVNTTSSYQARATELDVTLNVTGDTSQLFELPGGPVKFNVGGEYRRETARSAFDALTASGGTFLNAIQPFNPPALTVKEGFGEIEIPLLKDLPFVKELTLSGAGRISSYNTSAGTTYTYNGAVYYAPINDVRLRGSYARSVRVPTQSDLFSTASQNFASIADPCDAGRINNGTATRAANCLALGVPVGFTNTIANSQTVAYLSGGNPALKPEKSNSFTAGAIFEPHQIPGLSLTVDYYDIKVQSLIAGVSIQTIVNQCVDSPTINNSYCALLNPRVAGGAFPSVVGLASTLNFSKQTTSGVDVDLAYNHTFGGGGRLTVRTLFSYVIDKTNYLDPINPNIPTRQLFALGDPQLEGQFSAQYQTAGGFSVRYQFQYIGKQTIAATYAVQNSYNGLPPTNADQYPQIYYPEVTYHNLRMGFLVNKQFEMYAGVDNVFDKYPPFGLTGTGSGSGIYSNTGRQFYAGFKANF
ncbi:outer membrane receptor protein involved in Fe transport [Sphingomonas sp. BE270]|jgi:outer membrane receptor protein involved in Fe transport|nr:MULTISPECIES: TonB-dependent receptor [unclassified Sphingomonas]MDR6847300.1 outer membrane receptor protein involved in Fe transport [Sphingomonas sp. BE137]MDR7256844.1 outer membrane receptor protein involved in Fe transport [Sphingomonas sp. BE270]